MPLDIDVKMDNPKNEVIFSKTVELISAIHVLADSTHHEFASQWAKAMRSKLSDKSIYMLMLLSTLRFNGMELIEFVQKNKAFNDIRQLINTIEQHNNTDFIFSFLCEEVNKERINNIIMHKEELEEVVEDIPKLTHGNIIGLQYIFFNTEEFKRDIINLIREMNCAELNDKLKQNMNLYDASIAQISERLKQTEPLQLSQDITGMKFKRVFNFKEYYFIPSYFYSPHCIRFFNNNMQVIVYDMINTISDYDNANDTLSESLKLISDKTRLKILRRLITGSTYGKELAKSLDLTTATISHHLDQLKNIGLVSEKRIKNIKYFSANIEEIEKIFRNAKDYLFSNLNDEVKKRNK